MADNNEELQEMQMIDQSLHNVLMQKQAFEMELSETKSALGEINKSEEVYKMVGDLMMKSDKVKVKDELESKEKIIGMRIKALEKQEDSMTKRLDELRKKLSA